MTTTATTADTTTADTTTAATTAERVAEIVSSLDSPPSESRMKSLRLASEAGASDEVLAQLARAVRVSRGSTIVLPALHYEFLSRGRGWARKGRGADAEWGERVDGGGYRVGPGRWVVGATDGFRRKDSKKWTVKHVAVGGVVWTVAN